MDLIENEIVNEISGMVDAGNRENLTTVRLVHSDELDNQTLTELWHGLGSKAHSIFSDGSVVDAEGFRELARDASSHLWLVTANGRRAGITWLNAFEGYACRVHHGFYPSHYRSATGIAREGLKQIFEMKRIDGTPLTKTIFGLTPVPNRLAIRFARAVGFTDVMEIPDSCMWNGESAPGLLTYINHGDL